MHCDISRDKGGFFLIEVKKYYPYGPFQSQFVKLSVVPFHEKFIKAFVEQVKKLPSHS
jgi:hypothetical protein